MSKPDILVVWPNRPNHMALLAERYNLHRLDQSENPNALLGQVGSSIKAVATTAAKGVSNQILDKLPNVELIASSGTGCDKFDLDYCTQRHITLTNTPDLMTDDVADIAVALVLMTRRNLIVAHQWACTGKWVQKGMMPLTNTLRGKKAGIVGLGKIGRAIAERLIPMGLLISYTGPNEKNDAPYPYFADILKLADEVDILILSCPGQQETEHLINTDVLQALGENGTLINISRGSVVDQAALIEALKMETIASAGLDVYEKEPCDSLLFADMKNVVLSPHHASGTIETRDAMAQLVVDNLDAYFSNRVLLTPVT